MTQGPRISQFGRAFLARYSYVLSLSARCPVEEISINATPKPWGNEFQNFCKGFLADHNQVYSQSAR